MTYEEYLEVLETNKSRALQRQIQDLNSKALVLIVPCFCLMYVGMAFFVLWYLNTRFKIENDIEIKYRPIPKEEWQ